jgi:hypothetical protein
MEKRFCKVNISAAGGTASVGSKTYKLTLPSSWLLKMGVTEDDRQMEISFDGSTITISRPDTAQEFAAQKVTLGHTVVLFRYYDGSDLCTSIYADYTDHSLRVENHTEHLVKTAFGKELLPSWESFQSFLEKRCIPRSRADLREYLEAIGVDGYYPLEIIGKTNGRMAEDHQWLKYEVLK